MSFSSFSKVTANHQKRSLHISAPTFQPVDPRPDTCDAVAPQTDDVNSKANRTLYQQNVEIEAGAELFKNMTNMVNSGTKQPMPSGPGVEQVMTADHVF